MLSHTFLLGKISKHTHLNFIDNGNQQIKIAGFGDSFAVLFKSLLMLGVNEKIDTIRKRIVYFSIFFGGMMLFWLWEAMLISYFSFPIKSLPFNSLKEFVSKSDKKVVTHNEYNKVSCKIKILKGESYVKCISLLINF